MIALALALSICRDRPLENKPLDQQTPCELGMIGSFREGAWDGICWRDGNLSGFDHELCRVWWRRDGPVSVEIERTIEGLDASVDSPKCASVTKFTMKRPALANPRRSQIVLDKLRVAVARQAARCHVTVSMDALRITEIKAVLRQTDGLVPFP